MASRRKTPTVTETLRALLAALPATAAGIRDRAILLLGFAGALRRTELTAIDISHCAVHAEGVVIEVPSSAPTEDGSHEEVGVPYGAHIETCPVRALTAWLSLAHITDGPVFRPVTRSGHVLAERLTDRTVARIVKRAVLAARAVAVESGNAALAADLDPARYAGHSLRAGFIISAAAAGVSERDIMRHTRHKRAETLQQYMRHATVFRHNAAAKVGL
jgi:integrase